MPDVATPIVDMARAVLPGGQISNRVAACGYSICRRGQHNDSTTFGFEQVTESEKAEKGVFSCSNCMTVCDQITYACDQYSDSCYIIFSCSAACVH